MRFIDVDGSFDQQQMSRWRHKLADHPLMTTRSLAELALRIDPDYVRFHDGERRVGTDMNGLMTTDSTRQHLRHALENLHQAKTFVQMINVCSDPAYRALVDEVLDQALPFLPPRDHHLLNRDAAVFLASPMSVTPFHIDHEQNFLCHLRGPKTFYVWDHRDRSVVSERALEIFYRERRQREVSYRPDMQPKASVVELAPGDCIYMPMGSPHAASTGNDVTVTFSVLMNTRTSFETVETYRVNYMLRRLGLSPKPVGVSEVRDALKQRTLGAVRRVRDLAQGRGEEKDRRLHWY